MIEQGGGVHVESAFRLAGGAVLPQARQAYLTCGRLNERRDNAILVTHGYTSSHRFIEPGSLAAEGSWSALVGPGLAIDTDRFFVVSCNALGSCHGSTGPGSIDPGTGRPWGTDFPAITFEDVVRLQRALLASWGIERLHAVVGPSMGGFQALQWAVQYPGLVDRAVAAVAGFGDPAAHALARDALASRIRAQRGFEDGRGGGMVPLLIRLRLETLQHYGMGQYLADQGLDAAGCEQALLRMARGWAGEFEPWSLVVLRNAMAGFDLRPRLGEIRARLMLALSTTDTLFPASGLPDMLSVLEAAGVQAVGCVIDSPYGHLASGLDAQLWEGPLRAFLA